MTLEQRVELLENKLEETLRLLEIFIMLDKGLTMQNTDFLRQKLYEIEEME